MFSFLFFQTPPFAFCTFRLLVATRCVVNLTGVPFSFPLLSSPVCTQFPQKKRLADIFTNATVFKKSYRLTIVHLHQRM